MAKHSMGGGERSKVKMLYVEADMAPGDLETLTQALTAAIRPAQRVAGQVIVRQLAQSTDGALPEDTSLDVDATEEAEEVASPKRATGNSAPRKYRKPVVVEIDMSGNGVPWVEFAASKGPTSHNGRYLVAAAWLHEHAKIDKLSTDHIFTCYKSAGWHMDIPDPTAPFRGLKHDRMADGNAKAFALNHVAMAAVAKMKAG